METRSGKVYNTKKEETKVDDPAKLQIGAAICRILTLCRIGEGSGYYRLFTILRNSRMRAIDLLRFDF
ncbi:hypothetical protein LAZ67_7001231 [Cordylochernes scorpioides]|uniref:Uncharacterized protein n=1 Tax=Cordylochernes scorpioides TaxID=51811 RepID=A0ABY6KMN3_9ARAC|nr:hypothetical protein LAZ67_7001231 [Cordylochernes scorpioides]